MVTVYRESGFRIVIYLEDHEPAHVHVIGNGEAKINLLSARGDPELVWNQGLPFGDMRRIMRIVREQQEFLLAKWNAIHG